MSSQIEILIIIVCTTLGAIVSALLGWLESGNPFDQRKFLASMIRGVLASLINAIIFQDVDPVTTWTYLVAFLGGAGFDVVVKRGQAAINTMNN